MSCLRTNPLLCSWLIPPTIQNHDGGARILHLNVQDKIGELLVNRAARLLPFRLDDQIVPPKLGMIDDKVTVLGCLINTWPYGEAPCEDRLFQDASRCKATGRHIRITSLGKPSKDEAFQDGSRVISLGTTWDAITPAASSS